jgi:hypothetical protein
MNWIRKTFIVFFISFIIFELTSYLATKNKLFLINDVPKFYDFNPLPSIDYGRTEFEKWGAWHVPNKTFRQVKEGCFDVKMSFNEIGARDKSFKIQHNNSIILLGDSMAEGFGVEYDFITQTLLEEKLNREVLNFGASGNFGPLQQLLLYNKFRNILHSGVIIFFLPANDFQDNDIEFWSIRDRKRYRPYFNDNGNVLDPFYFLEAKPRKISMGDSIGHINLFIKEYFWSSNAIRTFLLYIRGHTRWKDEVLSAKRSTLAGYYKASDVQQKNVIMAYKQLSKSISKEKDILFVVIPSKSDIEQYLNTSNPKSYKKMKWYKGLQAIDNDVENIVRVLDLIEKLPPNPHNLFFDCDGHWNINGNRWASEEISKFIFDSMLFK